MRDCKGMRQMFQRIMVPLDGSERAEQALLVAARIARATHGALLLVQVVSSVAYVGAKFVSQDDTMRVQLQAAEDYLRGVAQREDMKDVPSSIKALEGALVADDILDIAAREQCDLMVLCSHGRTGLLRWALGSVAARLLHHATVPVLILRSGGPSPAHLQGNADHPVQALLTLDESPLAEAALVPAAHLTAALAAPSHGSLHLLEVLDLTYVGAERGERVLMDRDTRETVREDARSYLGAIAKRFGEGELGSLGLHVTWSLREDADAAATIIDVAEDGQGGEARGVSRQCDLICMATHGRRGLKRWMLGSITERVLHATKLPLLVVRPQGLDADGLGAGWLDVAGPGE